MIFSMRTPRWSEAIFSFAVLVCLAIPRFCAAQGYTINSVAGDGVQGYTGDNGPALQAELWAFSGVGLDRSGNILIADTGNCRIRRVVKGVIQTVAGNGVCGYSGDGIPATSSQLSFPRGVAVDAAGNMYIADTNNARVRKVDLNGNISTIAGDGNQNFSGDGGPATAAEVYDPWSIAVDGAGNVFFVDRSNQRVREIGADGNINTVAGNGVQAYAGDGGPATSASLYVPIGVALDLAGNVYIAESQSCTVRKVNLQGIIQTVAGVSDGTFGFSGDGGPATQAHLNDPEGLTVDTAGNIFIADEDNQRLREVTIDGIINTVAGNGTKNFAGDGGPSTNSAVDLPEGVAAGPGGTIYFVDSGNHRIRVLTPVSIVPGTACATNGNSSTAVADVQLMVNEALGVAMPLNDLNGDGVSNVVDVEIVSKAAIGLGCSAPFVLPASLPFMAPSPSVTARPGNNASTVAGAPHNATDIGTLGGLTTIACGIDDIGQVVGTSDSGQSTEAACGSGPCVDSHAFRWQAGLMTDLGLPAATSAAGACSWNKAVIGRAVAVNDSGQGVGFSRVGDRSAIHAVRFSEGTPSDLGTLGGTNSAALSIDNYGRIVGWSQTRDGSRHAFVYSEGRMVDLNSIAAPGGGAMLVEAVAINEMGQIVANGNNGRAYLVALPVEWR